MKQFKLHHLFIYGIFALLLAACADGGSGSASTFSISGSVVGLAPGQQVTIVNNGNDTLTVSSGQNFKFNKDILRNGSYNVAVSKQPTNGQFCNVFSGSGNGVVANVTNVEITCDVTVIHKFDGKDGGHSPFAGLVKRDDGFFYGTTLSGGTQDLGTVFRVNASGTSFNIVHSFTGGSDGQGPIPALIVGSDGSLYGMTIAGGDNLHGNIFKIATDGSFNPLYAFLGGPGDAELPSALSFGSDGLLYGVSIIGGANNKGAIFKLKTDGSGYSVIHSFNGGGTDGANPFGALISGNDGSLYGTSAEGGTKNEGTVYKTDSSGIVTVLHSFDSTQNGDGKGPQAALAIGPDGFLYGTTEAGGGANDRGIVFKVLPTGSSYTILHSFNSLTDGGNPNSNVTFGSDGYLYGTTGEGGTNDFGTLFKMLPDGTNYVLLVSLGNDTGTAPVAGLTLGDDGHFYGTTISGAGNLINGIVFRY